MTYNNSEDILRGEVYWVNLDPAIGSEVKKTRPAVIISNNIQNKISTRVVVIPITSQVKTIYPFEAKIMVANKDAKALTDQIRTIDKLRLGSCIEKLSKSEMTDIEKAIKLTLSLN
jgi:mRNA interferase MazF